MARLRRTINRLRRIVNQVNFLRASVYVVVKYIDNRGMSNRSAIRPEWQRRVSRAEELAAQSTFASEILRFYATVARFQEKLRGALETEHAGVQAGPHDGESDAAPFATPLPRDLTRFFENLFSLVEPSGPEPLRQVAQELRDGGPDLQYELLLHFWNHTDDGSLPTGPNDFFARALLQPYAARVREHANMRWTGPTPYVCPFCKRKPGAGVLRPLGDGGLRSLVCSFCLGEWEFRRIICPGCGEENHAKLPVYVAEDIKHVRVEACDSCRTYIKTIDMTTQGRAEPIVDEIAAIPLDVWAQKQGYSKLRVNLMQL